MPETIKNSFFPSPTPLEISNRLDAIETATAKKAGAIDAKGYGVTGNGSTDDSGKIQELLNLAIPAAASIEIYFPPGKYRLANELKVFSNTKIVAAVGAEFIRDHGKYLMMNGNRSSETNPSSAGGYTGRGNITVIGGTWNGNGVNQTTKGSIWHIGHGDQLTVMYATFKDVSTSHHIEFNACQNIYVEGCYFLGMANIGTTGEDYNECIQLDLSKNGVTTIGPADDTPCRNVYINNCYFGPSGTSGSGNVGRGIGSHTSTIGRPHFNINITNCTFENTLTWGIRAYNWRHVKINNNTLYNCGGGINWRSPITGVDTTNPAGTQVGSEATYIGEIIGNSIQGPMPTMRAIEIFGENGTDGIVRDVIVAYNVIRLAQHTNEAVLFHYAEACQCVGNRVNNAGTSGIVVRTNSSDVVLSANLIANSGNNGISVVGACEGISINGNLIRKSQGNGVYITDDGTDGITVSGNTITGVNGMNDTVAGNINHIRATVKAKNIAIAGNIMRNVTGFNATHAIYVTNSCTDVTTGGNMMPNLKLYNAALSSTTMVKDPSGDAHLPA